MYLLGFDFQATHLGLIHPLDESTTSSHWLQPVEFFLPAHQVRSYVQLSRHVMLLPRNMTMCSFCYYDISREPRHPPPDIGGRVHVCAPLQLAPAEKNSRLHPRSRSPSKCQTVFFLLWISCHWSITPCHPTRLDVWVQPTLVQGYALIRTSCHPITQF